MIKVNGKSFFPEKVYGILFGEIIDLYIEALETDGPKIKIEFTERDECLHKEALFSVLTFDEFKSKNSDDFGNELFKCIIKEIERRGKPFPKLGHTYQDRVFETFTVDEETEKEEL